MGSSDRERFTLISYFVLFSFFSPLVAVVLVESFHPA